MVAGAGIAVSRIGDSFHISTTAADPVVEFLTTTAEIDQATGIVVFSGAAGETLTAAPALEYDAFSVWNVGDDVTLEAAVGETINGAASIVIPLGYTADAISVVDGEWLVNVH